jgi:hypothetical protein
MIDIIFKAVNLEESGEDPDDLNPAQELCRYEFFEILIRIAVGKYCEMSKVCST